MGRHRCYASNLLAALFFPHRRLIVGSPDGGRFMELTADEFAGFSRPGYAKGAWNFTLWPTASDSTVLSTETRIKCFGRGAFWKFGLYWSLVSPFSPLMRKAILTQVKAGAESI